MPACNRSAHEPKFTDVTNEHAASYTQEDARVFALALRAITPLEDTDIAQVLAFSRPRVLARGQFLLQAGEHASEVGVVITGLLREYFVMPDGTERTKAFGSPGYPTGSLADLLSGQPSRAFIVAEEPTRILVADYAQSLALAERSSAWRRYGEQLTQRILLIKAEREYELLGMDAAARYARFSTRYPGLEARVAARHVASYLGITAVHLSRLRKRRRKAVAANGVSLAAPRFRGS